MASDIKQVQMNTEEEISYLRNCFIALHGLSNVVFVSPAGQALTAAIQAYIDRLQELADEYDSQ